MMNEAKTATGQRRIVCALVVALLGSAFIIGGIALIVAHGSYYYAVAGTACLASAVFIAAGDVRGARIYGGVLVGTLIWSIAEVGLDPWGLQARLLIPLFLGLWVFSASLRRLKWSSLIVAMVIVVAGVATLLYSNRIETVSRTPPTQVIADAADWPAYGHDMGGTHFSTASQINVSNVAQLVPAWTYRTGDLRPYLGLEVTPLMVDGAVYLCTSTNIVIALDPDTGQPRWVFDPKAESPPGPKCRGVAYYRAHSPSSACPTRIILATVDARLMAVDAKTGTLCSDFGVEGVVDLKAGMGAIQKGYYYVSSAPAIVRGQIILGGWVSDGQMVGEPSGVIRAFDAITGQLTWAWDMDRPDQHGIPPAGESYSRGTVNSWAPISGDEALGLVYLPMGNSTPDYWGGHRSKASEKYSSSVVALDAESGAVRWSYQTVHHDLWDYDVPAQPTLMDFPLGNKTVPALIQGTKRGQIFILDRASGIPLFRVEERSVAQGAAPGDFVSPTQPFSVDFPVFDDAVLKESGMWGLTPLDQLWCRVKFRQARYDGPLTPPGVRPTITYPGFLGGIEWGGLAADPENSLLVVNWNRMPNSTRLVPRAQVPDVQPSKDGLVPINGLAAQAGTPFALGTGGFISPIGVPCTEPPFGKIAVVDLRTHKTLWQRPLGTSQDSGPFGISSGVPLPMGVPNLGGAAVTRGGLIFIAATQEHAIRAFDIKTGALLWHARLPTSGTATPMTYISSQTGRQYVVIAVGGHLGFGSPSGDYIMAFALADKR